MPGPTLDELAGFRTVAPGSKTIRRTLVLLGSVTAIGAVVTLTGLALGISLTGRGFGMALTLLITGALGLTGLWLWLKNVRLLIGQGVVGYRNLFGRTRFWSRGEIDRIVSMAVNHGKSSKPLGAIYCFGIDGRRLLALSVSAWQPEDLKDFVEATGRPLDVRDAPVPARAARREFPKAFGWGAQHVMLATILTMLGGAVLVVAGYVLASKLLLK